MSSEAQACEQNILETLRRTFEAQGLTFVRNPGDDVIPSFLGGYKPDAIAVNQNGGGIVFEVKQRRSNATDKQLAEIAQKIAPHKTGNSGLFLPVRQATLRRIFQNRLQNRSMQK